MNIINASLLLLGASLSFSILAAEKNDPPTLNGKVSSYEIYNNSGYPLTLSDVSHECIKATTIPRTIPNGQHRMIKIEDDAGVFSKCGWEGSTLDIKVTGYNMVSSTIKYYSPYDQSLTINLKPNALNGEIPDKNTIRFGSSKATR